MLNNSRMIRQTRSIPWDLLHSISVSQNWGREWITTRWMPLYDGSHPQHPQNPKPYIGHLNGFDFAYKGKTISTPTPASTLLIRKVLLMPALFLAITMPRTSEMRRLFSGTSCEDKESRAASDPLTVEKSGEACQRQDRREATSGQLPDILWFTVDMWHACSLAAQELATSHAFGLVIIRSSHLFERLTTRMARMSPVRMSGMFLSLLALARASTFKSWPKLQSNRSVRYPPMTPSWEETTLSPRNVHSAVLFLHTSLCQMSFPRECLFRLQYQSCKLCRLRALPTTNFPYSVSRVSSYIHDMLDLLGQRFCLHPRPLILILFDLCFPSSCRRLPCLSPFCLLYHFYHFWWPLTSHLCSCLGTELPTGSKEEAAAWIPKRWKRRKELRKLHSIKGSLDKNEG